MNSTISPDNCTTDNNKAGPNFSPQTHSFNVGVAMSCGMEAAVIFNHILFWLRQNKTKNLNQIEGRTWMYESISNMQKHFPYITEKQIKYALVALEEHGYIIRAQYNENKFDKTMWYALSNEEWIDFQKNFSMVPFCPIGGDNLSHVYKDKIRKTDIENNNASDLTVRLSLFFFEQLQKINPKIAKPNLKSWAKELDVMMRVDNRTEDEIRKAIEYLVSIKDRPSSNGFNWATTISSVKSLRRNFHNVWAYMNTSSAVIVTSSPDQDRKFAEGIKQKFASRNDISVGPTYLEFINGPRSVCLEFGSKDFKTKALEQLRIKKLIIE